MVFLDLSGFFRSNVCSCVRTISIGWVRVTDMLVVVFISRILILGEAKKRENQTRLPSRQMPLVLQCLQHKNHFYVL